MKTLIALLICIPAWGQLQNPTPQGLTTGATVTNSGSSAKTKLSGILSMGATDAPGGAPAGTVAAGVIFSPNGQFSVKAFGAKGNTRTIYGGVMSSGRSTLTLSSGLFSNTDIGSVVTVAGAGLGGGTLTSTISAFIGATSVSLSNTAAVTVSGATILIFNDDTAAFQAAIDGCQAYVMPGVVGSSGTSYQAGAPVVLIPPGRYTITSQLVKKTCAWRGDAQDIGTVVIWGGPAGGIPVRIPAEINYPGGASFFEISGIHFLATNNLPSTWIEIGQSVDNFGFLHDDHFEGAQNSAIHITKGWVNLHWKDLRFDVIGGFAIDAVIGPGQYASSFSIDNFTYGGGPNGGQGLARFDNTTGGSDTGSIVFSRARVEINTPWTGNRSLVTMVCAAGPHCSFADVWLDNIAFQDATGGQMTNAAIFYNTNATGYGIKITNSHFSGMASFFSTSGGSYTNGLQMARPSFYSELDISARGTQPAAIFFNANAQAADFVAYTSGSTAFGTRRGINELTDSFSVTGEGYMNWSSPTPFANLSRPTAPFAIKPCSDCKNFADDSAAVGSAAAGNGHGAMVVWVNGSWRTMN